MQNAKACPSSDIPYKIDKENADIYTNYLPLGFNDSVTSSAFPTFFKIANITSISQKEKSTRIEAVDRQTLSQIYQKYLTNVYFAKYQISENHTFKTTMWL